MKKIMALIVVGLLIQGVAWAIPADKGLVDAYTSMVEKAGTYLSTAGKDKAFAAINDSKGEFVKNSVVTNSATYRDVMYVYIMDVKGDVVSHGINKLMIGQCFIDIRDAEGKLFYQEMIKEAQKSGNGWISYKMLDPISKKAERKELYFKKYGDYIVACATK
jgi:cytochrome c